VSVLFTLTAPSAAPDIGYRLNHLYVCHPRLLLWLNSDVCMEAVL